MAIFNSYLSLPEGNPQLIMNQQGLNAAHHQHYKIPSTRLTFVAMLTRSCRSENWKPEIIHKIFQLAN